MPGRPARRSRRAWGWHPLRPEWAERIVAGTPARAGDLVLDLGAGEGALTAPLLERGVRVLAFELHPGRAGRLRDRFGDRVTVVERDLRDLRTPGRPFRVVAAPPYAVTSALVATLLRSDRLLSADLVLQTAAAHRLAARGARRHRLEVGAAVPRRAFSPPPHVDSVVLTVRRR